MHNQSGRFNFYVKRNVENNSGNSSYSDAVNSQKWLLEEVRKVDVEEYNEMEVIMKNLLKDRIHLDLHDFDNWLDNSKEFDFMNTEFMKLLAVYTV